MKIGIDMGHNKGAGASKILNETTENRKIGKELIRMLKEKGHIVVDCTNENAINQLGGIVDRANAQPLDVFCSIHLNSGGGHGTETYIWNGSWSTKESVRAIAKNINDAVVKSCNFRNRGVKEANFFVLRKTKCPAVLIEVCFVDSQEDANKINHITVAKAIFKGLTGEEYTELPSDFNAVQYLLNNEDVMIVTNNNSKLSAKSHYDRYGRSEGRVYKNDVQYLRDNLDVLRECNRNSSYPAEKHYAEYGIKEGRSYKVPVVSSYKAKVVADVLNVREKASTNSKIVTTVKKNEVYTIIEECNGFGKLKSGIGWISLSYTTKC